MRKEDVVPWACVFKVTFPNEKIYIGSDTAKNAQQDYFKYFGSPSAGKKAMFDDMSEYLIGEKTYTLKKEILYSAENVTVGKILKIEQQLIKKFESKNPNYGYNR